MKPETKKLVDECNRLAGVVRELSAEKERLSAEWLALANQVSAQEPAVIGGALNGQLSDAGMRELAVVYFGGLKRRNDSNAARIGLYARLEKARDDYNKALSDACRAVITEAGIVPLEGY